MYYSAISWFVIRNNEKIRYLVRKTKCSSFEFVIARIRYSVFVIASDYCSSLPCPLGSWWGPGYFGNGYNRVDTN